MVGSDGEISYRSSVRNGVVERGNPVREEINKLSRHRW